MNEGRERTKGFKTLEKKYGITIVYDDFILRNGKLVETFKIIAADGCQWENGLTRAGVKRECEQWSKELLKIMFLNSKGE